jgi:hypothetical protein
LTNVNTNVFWIHTDLVSDGYMLELTNIQNIIIIKNI